MRSWDSGRDSSLDFGSGKSNCCRRCESSAAGFGKVEASWDGVEDASVEVEERVVAKAREASASLSEMKVSENITSYYYLVNDGLLDSAMGLLPGDMQEDRQ